MRLQSITFQMTFFALFGLNAFAQKITFEESNCRTQSTLEPTRKAWSFVKSRANRDLALEACLDSQKSMILTTVTGRTSDGKNNNVTQIRDEGYIEYYPQGNPDAISRCYFTVEKDQTLSDTLTKFINGEIRYDGKDQDSFIKLMKQMSDEMKNLVFIDRCLVS
jgi:hypothetical protein